MAQPPREVEADGADGGQTTGPVRTRLRRGRGYGYFKGTHPHDFHPLSKFSFLSFSIQSTLGDSSIEPPLLPSRLSEHSRAFMDSMAGVEKLVPVPLVGRNPIMPEIYETFDHPQLSSVLGPIGRVYIGGMPASNLKAMEDIRDAEGKMKCPPGGRQDWLAQGRI